MLDAVDAGVQHVIERHFREAVGGDARAFVMGGLDGIADDGGRERRSKVAGVAVNPVPHELDPSVAFPGLFTDSFHQALRFNFLSEPPQVPARARNVATGADQHRDVRRPSTDHTPRCSLPGPVRTVPVNSMIPAMCTSFLPGQASTGNVTSPERKAVVAFILTTRVPLQGLRSG